MFSKRNSAQGRPVHVKHGSRTFPPGHFPPERNANNVVKIEAAMIKQYFSSRSWIYDTIHC